MNQFRSLLLLPAALLLAACGDSRPASNPDRPGVPSAGAPSIPNLVLKSDTSQHFAATYETFERLPEALPPLGQNYDGQYGDTPALAQAKSARRDGDQLLLQPSNGPVIVLRTVHDQPANTVGYRYWGELPTAHQWVVAYGLSRGTGTLLIDQRTGARKRVWGDPAVSPDGHHIFTASRDLLGDGSTPNGIQLYRVGPDSLTLVGQREIGWLDPMQGRWLNDHAVILKLSDGDYAEMLETSYLGLELAR